MTVSYNLDVSVSSAFSFAKLLFRWRGSVWKAVHRELAVWLILYYIIFFIYRYGLSLDAQKAFGLVAAGCDKELNYIPLTFLLSFFVSIIIDRWKNIISNMGWIENNALNISTLLRGSDEKSILERRSVIRYLVLSQVLVFRNISMKVRRRFPTMESIIRQGFMTPSERDMLKSIDIPYNKYWAPIQWAMTIIINKANEEPKIAQAYVNTMLAEMRIFRNNLSMLVNYDWVPIPLAYPQVVFLAVRVYFLVCTVSRQFIIGNDFGYDLYFPFMTVIQFVFLTGWMKIAEALLNPLGEDDDDFECNFLIDKNIITGLAIVDDTYNRAPTLGKDKFLNKEFRKIRRSKNLVMGSAAGVHLQDSPSDSQIALDELVSEESQSTESRPRSLTQRVMDAFHVSTNENTEFDKNGEYAGRYFSQMSRY